MKRLFLVLLLTAALASACTSQFIDHPTDGGTSSAPRSGTTDRAMTWQQLPDVPLSPRNDPLVIRVGGRVVAVGGTQPAQCPSGGFCPFPGFARGGAVFDLHTQNWHRMATPPAEFSAGSPAGIDGNRLVVMGNAFPAPFFIYDAIKDSWKRLPASPAALGGDDFMTVANGTAYVNPGDDRPAGDDGPGSPPIQRLNLSTGHWSLLPASSNRPRLDLRRLFVTPRGLLVMGATGTDSHHPRALAEVFEHGHWTRLSDPKLRAYGYDWHWTGRRMVAPFPDGHHRPGVALTVDSGQWSLLPKQGPNALEWQVNGDSAGDLVFDMGEVYDDSTQTSTALKAPSTAAKERGSATWVGHQLLVVDSASHAWLMPTINP